MTCISESNSRLGCPNLELGTTTTDFQKPIPVWDTFHFWMGGDPIPNRNIPIRIGPLTVPFWNGTNSVTGNNINITSDYFNCAQVRFKINRRIGHWHPPATPPAGRRSRHNHCWIPEKINNTTAAKLTMNDATMKKRSSSEVPATTKISSTTSSNELCSSIEKSLVNWRNAIGEGVSLVAAAEEKEDEKQQKEETSGNIKKSKTSTMSISLPSSSAAAEDFAQRLRTYKSDTYFSKPDCISPIFAARLG